MPACEATTKPRIMFVEDDDSGRQLLQEWLELMGYEVFSLPDGRDFMLTLEKISPDLLLLDLKLPHIDGFTLLEQLQTSAWRSLPVIVLSAYNLQRTRDKAAELGCTHYLVKPTPLDTLQGIIQSALDDRELSESDC
ncbi:MAG: response regulator [Cyanobacteria bacterium P01_D01_bin.123]